MKKFYEFDENFYLISQKIENDNKNKEVKTKTNHIFIVDVSGSMSHDLPLIRTQLKNRLSSIMNEGDTISIIWFSGKNQSGILKEEVEVKSLKTLTDLNNAIDKWLHPIGLTAFLKPLELTKELVERIKVNRPDSVFSMIFLTDGYNNDCSWTDVKTTLKSLENDIISSTFVEYGYYADSQKLTEMASMIGGEKISCDGFDEFEPVFNNKISSGLHSTKKIEVNIDDEYLYDYAYSIGDGSIILYKINEGKILVNDGVDNIYFFSNKAIGSGINGENPEIFTPLYAAVYTLSDKLLNYDAEKVFYGIGDNYYYKMLVNAFGKQKLNAFKNAIKDCVFDVSKRFLDGFGEIKPVNDNAYCLLNLINDLTLINNNKFYPSHPEFNYSLIGVKKIVKGSQLSESEKKMLSDAKNINDAAQILNDLKSKNVDVEFITDDPEKGYPLTDLVWNSERANLSVRVRIDGKVKLPDNNFGINEVSSFKYRTYTIIKDGIVNIKKLPVLYTPELIKILDDNGVKYTMDDSIHDAKVNDTTYGKTVVIDLTSIPVINRGMVKSISAKQLAEAEWDLIKIQASKKVYDYYKNNLYPKTSKSYANIFGQECADWLKDIGITDYNGFAPKTITAETEDFYYSVNLATKIKGLSTLPKVVDVENKLKEGKPLKIGEALMSEAIIKYNTQFESDMFKTFNEEQQKNALKTYIETKSEILNVKRWKTLQKIASIKFALILTKQWFVEFKSFDENKLTLTLDGYVVDFTFDLSEKEVAV